MKKHGNNISVTSAPMVAKQKVKNISPFFMMLSPFHVA